jgi:hypothetical protein
VGRSLRSHHRAQDVSCALIIRPEAEADLAEGFDWYEQRRSGLGNEFLNEVNTRLRQIEANPLGHPLGCRTLTPIQHRQEHTSTLAVRQAIAHPLRAASGLVAELT